LGDIKAIHIGDIQFDRNIIATRNRKAKKVMLERSIPETIMTELSNYVAKLPDKQERLFSDKFSVKRWEKVRKAMGLAKLQVPRSTKNLCALFGSKRRFNNSDSEVAGTLQFTAYE